MKAVAIITILILIVTFIVVVTLFFIVRLICRRIPFSVETEHSSNISMVFGRSNLSSSFGSTL